MTTHQFPQKRGEVDQGLIGIVCGELTRYVHFWMCMLFLDKLDTKLQIDPGSNITNQCNAIIKRARKEGSAWVWIMGDDHAFFPDILIKLLAHDVDVVVPHCLQRSAPYNPVQYKGLNHEGHHELEQDMPEKGLHEIYAAGSAGMLVRKKVIDALPEKPFITTGGNQNEDLEFCRAIREAGFKLWCDVETPLAHIGTQVVWPHWMDEYGWGAMLDIGPQQRMPVRRIAQGPSLTAA